MKDHNVINFVFSSSATVYGSPKYLPLDEKHPCIGNEITNPYGKTKYVVEHILKDLCHAEKDWNVIILRYFNPVGAHESGLIGEDPQGPPANLMPFVSQVAVGRRPCVNVFGNDYETPDGTGVRDYIHITDLATGHSCAVKKLAEKPGLKIYNLGTGKGYSVLEMIKAMEAASGKTIPFEVCPRRAGDIGSVYADASLAEKELNWNAAKGLDDMCKYFY
jgi:UDP-glucose 4-epimerase